MAAAGWHRAARAFREFVRSLEAKPDSQRKDRLSMPPCVWYGRSVFCFHVPSSTRLPKAVEQGRVADDTR